MEQQPIHYNIRNKGTKNTLWVLAEAAWLVLAATTAVFSHSWASSFVEQNKMPYSGLFTVAIILLFYLMIDYGNGGLLRKLTRERKQLNKDESEDHRLKNIIWYTTLSFLVIRVIATTTTSFWAIGETSKILAKESNDEYYFELANMKRKERDSIAFVLERQLKEAKSKQKQRTSAAQQQKIMVVNNAIATGDKWQQLGLQDGGVFKCWMCSPANRSDQRDVKYCNKIKQAYAKGDSLIFAAKNITLNIQNKIDQLSNGEHNKTIASFEQLGFQEKEDYKTTINNYATILWIVEPLAAIVGIVCSLLLALMNIVGKQKQQRLSIRTTLSEWKRIKHDQIAINLQKRLKLEELERQLNQDLDGNGEVGNVDETTSETIIEELLQQNGMSENLASATKEISATIPVSKTVSDGATKSATESETTFETPPLPGATKSETKAVTLVKQASQPETTFVATKSETKKTHTQKDEKTGATKSETKTVAIETITDKRYLKQLCKQKFMRSFKTTSKPETRVKNRDEYIKYKNRLAELGVVTKEIRNGENLNVIFEEV